MSSLMSLVQTSCLIRPNGKFTLLWSLLCIWRHANDNCEILWYINRSVYSLGKMEKWMTRTLILNGFWISIYLFSSCDSMTPTICHTPALFIRTSYVRKRISYWFLIMPSGQLRMKPINRSIILKYVLIDYTWRRQV